MDPIDEKLFEIKKAAGQLGEETDRQDVSDLCYLIRDIAEALELIRNTIPQR